MRHANRGLKLAVVVAALTASTAFARDAHAQAQPSPISFGVIAGATKATGHFGDSVDLGYHVGGLVQWNGPDLPIGIRGDVVYHRFSEKNASSSNTNILGGTLNGVYDFATGPGAPLIPYLIGGVGFYHRSSSCTGCTDNSENKFGLNGGGGLSFPLSGFSAFIEARYHHIFTSGSATNMIPISVGIIFRP